jgi:hypothetical protein
MVEPFLEHTDQAGDALVLRTAEAQRLGERLVGGAPHHQGQTRVGYGFRCGADGDHHLARQPSRDGDDAVGERGEPQVRLDARQHDEVVRSAREPCQPELVLRPAGVADVVVVELRRWTFLGEVEERIRVDGGHHGCHPIG